MGPYTAVVLAGGRAARLGGRAKPQLEVGGRTMLATVLAAVTDADLRIVVGPRQPVPEDVLIVREEPPGGGPVATSSARRTFRSRCKAHSSLAGTSTTRCGR